MPRRSLVVGNCSADRALLSRWLQKHFDTEVATADTLDQALLAMQREAFDLVLVNRVFHSDGRQGLELIRRAKADARAAQTPIMLVSNFSESQAHAVAEGAAPGFGKDDLYRPEAIGRVAPFLAAGGAEGPAA